MGRSGKYRQWGPQGDRHEPLGARLSLLLILTNMFVWIGLRNVDILVVSLVAAVVAMCGLILGYRSGKQIRRYNGRISGESIAMIGYWGNLVLFLLSFFLFAYTFLLGVLRGEFI